MTDFPQSVQTPEKKKMSPWLIVLIVVVVLCCCAVIGVLIFLYATGNAVMNQSGGMESIIATMESSMTPVP